MNGNILGVSAGHHDAAISLVDPFGEILFAGHSERYSRVKNDPHICAELLQEVSYEPIDTIAYYERPWAKELRKLVAGQKFSIADMSVKNILQKELFCHGILNSDVNNVNYWRHHLSHAAAGFQTSPFEEATVVIIDAIGEFDTTSIWRATYDKEGIAKYKLLWRKSYPNSIGLFYSAATAAVGLKPNEDEYILMGMSAYGSREPKVNPFEYVSDFMNLELHENYHTGMKKPEGMSDVDFAQRIQVVTTELVEYVLTTAKWLGGSRNLVYGGGVALNCMINSELGWIFDNVWIMPCPGDAGSSLGAAALSYGKKLNWKSPYLGKMLGIHYPVDEVVNCLLNNGIAGVASGAAEFGPRALGNRSLLADPRTVAMKDKVNDVKQRQRFRPFAPAILAEYAADNFDMPLGWSASPYMQVTAVCKHPELYPAIVHVDGTSRVQTVSKHDRTGLRKVLEQWFDRTGCPMLLNTSLNIKGEPLVNSIEDAKRFAKLNNVHVFW